MNARTGALMAKLSLEIKAINSENTNEYTIQPGASQADLDGSVTVTDEKALGAAISAFLSDRPLELEINFKIAASLFVFPVCSAAGIPIVLSCM